MSLRRNGKIVEYNHIQRKVYKERVVGARRSGSQAVRQSGTVLRPAPAEPLSALYDTRDAYYNAQGDQHVHMSLYRTLSQDIK